MKKREICGRGCYLEKKERGTEGVQEFTGIHFIKDIDCDGESMGSGGGQGQAVLPFDI